MKLFRIQEKLSSGKLHQRILTAAY